MEITVLGAVAGLAIAVLLIVFRVAPVYSLIAGAFLGGLIGGASPTESIAAMTGGAASILPASLRILTAGVLAGVLIESGAAARIAQTITGWFGQTHALAALVVATMFLTAVGVFIDIAVITVSPIALAVARDVGCSRFAVLFAMIGGGKSGNVISPNPNTITAAMKFDLELPQVMAANLLPALAALVVTILVASYMQRRSAKPAGDVSTPSQRPGDAPSLPPFWAAISGPVITIVLLALRPASRLFEIDLIEIDPLIALPAGGIAGGLLMGKARELNRFATSGLQRMTGVTVLLLGTGTVAGIIKESALSSALVDFLAGIGLEGFLLAPIAGIFMSAATASTMAGTTVACEAFHDEILATGTSPLAAAAMIHSGATVLDHLPHGSFFHATGGSVGMAFGERVRMNPLESTIGLVLVGTSTLVHGVLNW